MDTPGDEESQRYEQVKRAQSLSARSVVLEEMSKLQELISSGLITEESEKWEAQKLLLTLQKEANQYLLDIKKNTTPMGEFNKPGFIKTMTYYDYMAKTPGNRNIEIGDAKIVIQVQTMDEIDNVEKIMGKIKKSFGESIKQREFAAPTDQDLYR